MAHSNPTYLLVHGSGHGAWCWRDVLTEMARRGLSARALDLPSHGADATPIAQVSLEAYRDAILADIDAHAGGPVVLVGHSAGGYPISAVAEAAPDKVARLVYVCAYVPCNGVSLADRRRAAPSHPILDVITRTNDGLAFQFIAAKAPDALFHDCPPEVIGFAVARLGPQAIAPQETPLPLTAAYASVPRSYVICDHDRIIPPVFQATMTLDWPATSVHHLPSSHSPFFSMPARLVDCIVATPTKCPAQAAP
ncbi:alpha/beta fold hydrolase [Celeribacter sp.]|uniref:alpha/beta fold hydrolase n=1 Tax=Celeribacter sp. TaxID=1890673 RepID=UPI003A8F6C8C